MKDLLSFMKSSHKSATRKLRQVYVISDDPQIRDLIKNNQRFESALNSVELSAWISLKSVIANFLGNKKSSQYQKTVGVTGNFHKLGARMSVKIQFIHFHLDYFPENCCIYREEQGKRFHQDGIMEKRYQIRWDVNF